VVLCRNGIEEPSWEELYGENQDETKPFEDYFCKPADADDQFDSRTGVSDPPHLTPAYSHITPAFKHTTTTTTTTRTTTAAATT